MAKTLKYDLNGNVTNVVTAAYTNSYEWDAADRLVAINGPTNRSEFTYDGLGRRTKIVEKQNGVAVSTNYFAWCGTELCEARTGTGGTVAKRFFGQGEQISGTNYFFTRDHLGSVREMTDGSSTIRARCDYDPYGKLSKLSGNADADFGFTGYYVHAVSGLHLALFRAYDPDTARWVNRDPIQELGGMNLYGFVINDPIGRKDTFGLLEAISAYNYWNDLAVGGATSGGFWGNAQAAGASVMEAFIDFFGARSIEKHAAMSGDASGKGCTGRAIGYGGLTVGEIGLAALAGWTGGGGAGATGVKTLKQAALYELGSQTIKGEVFQTIKHMNPVARGEYLLKEYGAMETLLKIGPLKPSFQDWLKTLPQGPTPGGYVGMETLIQTYWQQVKPCN